jgi:hypothetical protein
MSGGNIMFLRMTTLMMAIFTIPCTSIADEASKNGNTLIDDPVQWLVSTFEQNQAFRTYGAMRVAAGPDSARLNEIERPAVVTNYLRDLRARPTTWQADEWPELEAWLVTMRPLISHFAAAQPERRAVDDALRRDIGRGIILLPHHSLYYDLRLGLIADTWCAGASEEKVTDRLQLLQRLGDELATSSFAVDLRLAEEIRDDIARSLAALAAQGRLTGDQVQRLAAQAKWAERRDLRCVIGKVLDANLAGELCTIDYLSDSNSEIIRARLTSANQALGSVLSASEVQEATRESVDRLRRARISLNRRLHDELVYLSDADADDRVKTLEAIAIAESGAPALTRLVSPGGYTRLLRVACDAEASRRGRAWVRAVLRHAAGRLRGTLNEAEGQAWCRRPLWLPRDPYGSGRLILRERDGAMVIYSRGYNGRDDEGDPNSDLPLFEVSMKLIKQ